MGIAAISWWAVITAAVVKFVIGGIWYSPPVFGTEWQKLVGQTPEEMRAGLPRAMIAQAIGDLVMAYILARFIAHYGTPSLASGLLIGFMAWLGFVATVTVGQIFYEKRPWRLWLINNGYLLLGILVMGAILGWWQGAPVAAVPAA